MILHSGASLIVYYSLDISTSSNRAQGTVYKFESLSPHIGLVQRKGKYNEKYEVIIKTISKKMYLSHEEMVIN